MSGEIEGPKLEVPDATIPGEFFRTVDRRGDATAVKARKPGTDVFEDHTWEEVQERIRHVSHGLKSLGVEAGDRVAIQSPTRFEWMIADLAILSLGAVTTTVYATLTPDEGAFLLNDSGSTVLFSSDQEQFDKYRAAADDIDSVEHVVTFDPVDAGELDKRTQLLSELEEAGRAHAEEHPDAFETWLDEVDPRAPASIVYTSGTTGRPKGCVLTHRNFIAAAESVAQIIDIGEEDTGLAFLPLAHVYQRLTGIFVFRSGAEVVFTTPSKIADDLKRFQPTMMASVPRIYERMYDAVIERVEQDAGPVKQALFEAASQTARDYGRALSDGGTPGAWLSAKHALFDNLVYANLREQLGAAELRHVITGAAAIRPDLLYWFRGIGLPILEGYGLTETSAPSNINRPDRFKPGTVGPPIPGVKQKIRPLDEDQVDQHDDAAGPVGEVLMKGPNVFNHYFELEEETEEAFTDDGWFKSGDIGYFDEDGYLKIVDRLKQLEVLSTGKNVAPVPIEEALKNSDWVAEAMVVGSDRKFVTALIEPNYEKVLSEADDRDVDYDPDAVNRVETPTGTEVQGLPRSLLEQPWLTEEIEAAVDAANEGFNHYEQVKKFRLLPRSLSMDHDELTPTLKKKRRNIRTHFEDLIDEMYPED